jgi:hypothetical protein
MSYLYDATGPVVSPDERKEGARVRHARRCNYEAGKTTVGRMGASSWDGAIRMHNSARGKGVVGCMQSVVGFYTRYGLNCSPPSTVVYSKYGGQLLWVTRRTTCNHYRRVCHNGNYFYVCYSR